MTPPGDDRLDQQLVREAATALPPRRDDEPASLRQDILDELGDHLACAFRRELLRTNGDAAQAETNVRQRFGDPATVARRLWFDAMKGTLMVQRMLVGICALLVAACVMLGLLLWRTMGRLDEVAADPEWNPMTARCVTGFDKGPPVAGMTVVLNPRGESLGPAATVTTESDGLADFGLRRPGYYRIEVRTPWGEENNEYVTVQPGRPSDTVIVCPSEPPPTANVRWDVTWPESAKSHGDLWYVLHLRTKVQRKIADEEWDTGEDERLVAFHPSGRVIDLVLSRGGPTIPPRARQQIERMRQLKRPPNPHRYWADVEYEATSAGMFRWDGDGPPAEMLGDARKIVKWSNVGGWVALQWVDRNWFVDKWKQVEKRSDDLTFTADDAPDAGSPSTVAWTLTVPESIVAEAIENEQAPDDSDGIQVTPEEGATGSEGSTKD